MYSGFSVPQHCKVFSKQMHNSIVPCLPDIHFLPVDHTGWVLRVKYVCRLLSTVVKVSQWFHTKPMFRKTEDNRCNTINTMIHYDQQYDVLNIYSAKVYSLLPRDLQERAEYGWGTLHLLGDNQSPAQGISEYKRLLRAPVATRGPPRVAYMKWQFILCKS